MTQPPPFSRYEWMIAFRYLRARRSEGGISVMTWISLIGITLAVAALIITLAVRSGFRDEFVGVILGANGHAEVRSQPYITERSEISNTILDYEAWAKKIEKIPGVLRAAPTVKGQVLANNGRENIGVEVFGLSLSDLKAIPKIARPERFVGDIDAFEQGIAIGSGVAFELGLGIGDKIKLISPNGVKTAFGTTPRVNYYDVTYIFTAGRWDIDRTRVYLPLVEAQSFFNLEAGVDQIEIMVEDPEKVDLLTREIVDAPGEPATIWTWRDRSGAFLRALEMEDRTMFVILSVLVLIASMNITSGLIMLVKNKGRDIGILRTIGLSEGAVLRVFFLCGSLTGVIGTAMGVGLGCLFVVNIDTVFLILDYVAGGGVWDPEIRGIYRLPAKLQQGDVFSAVGLSLFLSFAVTYLPARRAARLNPVEALRYE